MTTAERNAVIEECAAIANRWANDAEEFADASERSRIQMNVCRNMATAIRNLKSDTAK